MMTNSTATISICDESAKIQMARLLPLMLYIFGAFTGLAPLSSSSSSPLLLEVQSNPYRQLLYGSLYLWSGIIILKNRGDFRPIIADWTLPVIFIFYALTSILWSDFPIKVLKDSIHLLGALMIATVSASETEKSIKPLLRVIFLSTSMILVASIMSVIVYPEGAILGGWSSRWRGVAMHPNYLGLAAMLCILSSLTLMLYRKKKFMQFLSFAMILISSLCLIKSNSITSILISIILIPIVILFRPQDNSVDRKNMHGTVAEKIMISFVFILPALHFTFIFWPELFSMNKFFQIIDRTPDLTGRVFMWERSWNAFLSRPILGWGYDGLLTVKKAVFGTDIPFFQLHNGYLNLIVMTGITGGIITLLLFIEMTRRLWIMRFVDSEVYLFGGLFLFAFLLHNLTESSVFLPTHVLWVLFICIYLLLGRLKSKLLLR